MKGSTKLSFLLRSPTIAAGEISGDHTRNRRDGSRCGASTAGASSDRLRRVPRGDPSAGAVPCAAPLRPRFPRCVRRSVAREVLGVPDLPRRRLGAWGGDRANATATVLLLLDFRAWINPYFI
uniref:Uncharacterized protein n=1 Tax=Ananas comosus var. bracteatus TaxID=296719 RepID=A0A6V7NT14_ANACO|nr:unnamed protein product [Ananas comosus var. bracteatus]